MQLHQEDQALFCRRRHQPMTGHFGRLVTRSSLVTTATALLAITVSSRKNPNSATRLQAGRQK